MKTKVIKSTKSPQCGKCAAPVKVRKAALKQKPVPAEAAGVKLPVSTRVQAGPPKLVLEGLPPLPEVQAINVPQTTGKVKLETSRMSGLQVKSLLATVGTGMAATPEYAALPVLGDVTNARSALTTLLENLTNLETQLLETRVTLEEWTKAGGTVLQRAALACENENSSAALLINAGWTLRSGRGPAHEMPAPAGLRLRQTQFAGQGVARWTAVPNARYYEVRIDPVPDAALTIPESITVTSVRVDAPLPAVAPGSMVRLCVRAVGVKGAGPFCDALTARVN
jgi:hypothetical protein